MSHVGVTQACEQHAVESEAVKLVPWQTLPCMQIVPPCAAHVDMDNTENVIAKSLKFALFEVSLHLT